MPNESLRSVTRTLLVMQALQRLQACSLATLQAECQLPKPTLLRLLHTLEQEHFAWRATGDGLWRPAFELRPTPSIKPAHQRLIKAALPVLEELRRSVIWPSDVAMRDGHTMRLLENTRRASGLSVSRYQIGDRADLLRSALGLAWIAGASDVETRRMAKLLARAEKLPEDTVQSQLAAIQEDYVRNGYTERAPGFGGTATPIHEYDDQLAAIGVPVVHKGSSIGAINVLWLKRFDAKGALLRRHIKELHAAAKQIAVRWHGLA